MQFAGSIGWLLLNWLTGPFIYLFNHLFVYLFIYLLTDWLINWKLNVPTKHPINQLTESKELNNMITWKKNMLCPNC